MREVRVRCTWQTDHVIEVPDDAERFGNSDLDELLDVSGEDVTPDVAELIDWEVKDKRP